MMAVPDSKVYQFNVSLKGSKPKIWRRVQVPENYTFWDMHVAIQDLMPWEDYCLHQFRMKNCNSGRIDYIGALNNEGYNTVEERETKLKDYFFAPEVKGDYLYNYGLEWFHEVVLESISPAVFGVKYPQCTAGENQCYSEDGDAAPPETPFDIRQVLFKDPEEYWGRWFGNELSSTYR